MKVATRWLAVAVMIPLAVVVAWRVVVVGMSDHLGADHPSQASTWNAANPQALLARAQAQLKQAEPAAAAVTTRALLRHEPLSGQGFVLLSEAARMQGDTATTQVLSRIALRRVPQALAPRAWLAGDQLAQGHYAEALKSIDQILRVWPSQNTRLFPALIELSANEEFADALALELIRQPTWKNGFIDSLLRDAPIDVLAKIFSALQRHGAMDVPTMGRWIDRLVKVGAWGEAYARWVSPFSREGLDRVANVYNGGFETQPSGAGFDWRIGDSAGVFIERAAVAGSGGSSALTLQFLGRRVDSIPVNHWLLLSAGPYRLEFRASARDLRSDRGVQWVIACQGSGNELAATDRLDGSFDWRGQELEFTVPERDCQAQDLWLRNAGAAGGGKIIRGAINFDDFAIHRSVDSTAKPQDAARAIAK